MKSKIAIIAHGGAGGINYPHRRRSGLIKAVQAGYIKIKKQFSDLDGIRPGERFLFRKYNEEIGHLAVLNDGKVMLRGPDYIKSDIVLRIVNKLKT